MSLPSCMFFPLSCYGCPACRKANQRVAILFCNSFQNFTVLFCSGAPWENIWRSHHVNRIWKRNGVFQAEEKVSASDLWKTFSCFPDWKQARFSSEFFLTHNGDVSFFLYTPLQWPFNYFAMLLNIIFLY